MSKLKSAISAMPKSYLRYRLYRLRTELEKGVPYDLDPEVPEYFEKQELFQGFGSFGIQWDVRREDGVWVIYSRMFTEGEEWNAKVRSLTDFLPMRRRKANVLTEE